MTASASGQYCDIDLAPLSDAEKIRVALSSCCFLCGETIKAAMLRKNGFAIEHIEEGWRFICHGCDPVDLTECGDPERIELPEVN